MKEVIAWEEAKKEMKKYGISYSIYTNRIWLKNKNGQSLGHFDSAVEVVNYMHGYGDGLLDAKRFKE